MTTLALSVARFEGSDALCQSDQSDFAINDEAWLQRVARKIPANAFWALDSRRLCFRTYGGRNDYIGGLQSPSLKLCETL